MKKDKTESEPVKAIPELNERVRDLMNEHSVAGSYRELAKLINVSESTLSRMKKTGYTTDANLQKLAVVLKTTFDYLRYGIVTPEEETQKVKAIPNSTPLKARYSTPPKISGNVIYVPMSAYAGFSSGNTNPLTNEDLEVWTLPFIKYFALCFEINGDSMRDTLQDGEFVLTEQQEVRRISDIQNEFIHVVETSDGNYLVKRVSKTNKSDEIVLQSDNYDFEDVIMHYPTDFKRIWKVKNSFKWDLSYRERIDKEFIDTDIEKIALRLDEQND